jgi:hypothetical protein
VSEPDFAAQLAALRDMGFTDEVLLTELLKRNKGLLQRTLNDLLSQ